MAASFRSIANAPDLQDESGKFFHAKSGRQYEIVRRDGRLFQRRFEHDSGGREANAFELEVTHSIGSGNHARSYLHRMESGEFVQLPLTWYTQEKSWGMSPGYDSAAPPDFIRIVDENCLFCHNGYTRPDGTVAQGIDCQRCHGPGSTHVDLASASKPDAASIRSAIVNPKRLSPALQTDICMQCHLETTSAELPPNAPQVRSRPVIIPSGEPLGSYVVHFDHPPKSGHDDKFEIVNQAYRLRQSRCFLESGGRLPLVRHAITLTGSRGGKRLFRIIEPSAWPVMSP